MKTRDAIAMICIGAMSLAAFAESSPAAWQRPATSRRYLQGPFSERLIVSWREGKVTIGEVRHWHDWKKTSYYQAETTPAAFGAWLVHGEADEPFDFRTAKMRVERDAVPIHGQSWTIGAMTVDVEACVPFGRRPSANMRLRVSNAGVTNITCSFAVLLRSAKERELVFSAPDGYFPYAPVLTQWTKVPKTWSRRSESVWGDGERFFAVDPGIGATWDDAVGAVRFTVKLAPGLARNVDFVLGEGEVEQPHYERAREQTSADWRRELSRVTDRPWLIRRMTVEMLQCFSRPIGAEYALPRQGGLQRWVWPGDQMEVSQALDMLGYREYVEGALDFYFGEYANANGEIGPFGNSWACNTACVLHMFAYHCLGPDADGCWNRWRGAAVKAFDWIRAKRRESAGRDGCVPGLFPPMKATDAAGAFQSWGHTDLINLMALETFAAAVERRSPAEAAPFRAEAADYRRVIEGIVAHWRKDSEGQPCFHLPLDPLGKEEDALRKRNYFYCHPGRFAMMGFLTEDEMLRLRNWLLREGYADVRGLYQRHPTRTCWDMGLPISPEVAENVWYTTFSELGWFTAWKTVGRDDLAAEILDATLRYSVSEEGCVCERYCATDPWFHPWSPNASGAGRIVMMALGCGSRVARQK